MSGSDRADPLPPAGPLRRSGRALHGRRLGSGPPVVLLHGGPGLDHHSVIPLALALADRFEVWCPDLPGHGRSHTGSDRLPDLEGLVRETGAWMADFRGRYGLVGHSLGAWLAAAMMRRNGVRPAAAVWIAPPSHRPEGAAARGRGVGSAAASRRRRERPPALRTAFVEFCLDGDAFEPLAGASGLDDLARRARLRPPEAYVALRGQLARALAAPEPRFAPGIPVRILAGRLDRVCPPDAAARLAAAVAGAEFEILEGAGHMPFVCADDGGATERVREFLARHVAG